MKQEDTFLRAIESRPQDEGLRLIYADWLEEQGDPRGEFIRLQQAMAALPVYSDRYVELKPRRDELRRHATADWLRRLGYTPTYRPLFTQLPERRVERWRLVAEFIELWYKPLRPGDGATEKQLAAAEKRLGFLLPAALREWYALAGNRKDVWSKQDSLERLSSISIEERYDALVFRYENQNCDRWGIRVRDLGIEDPPVFGLEVPAEVSPATTTFAIQVLLYEAPFGGPHSSNISGCADLPLRTTVFDEIRGRFTKCGIPELDGSAVHDARFYEGKDLVIATYEGDGIVFTTARTEEAHQQLPEALRSAWTSWEQLS